MKKRILKILLGLAAILIVFALFQYFYSGNPNILNQKDRFDVIAHRGVHQNWEMGPYGQNRGCKADRIFEPAHDYIENTLESMRAAFDFGATIVEIDVRRTKDDHLVIFHDYTLECRTNGTGNVSERTLKYLRTLDVGYGYTHDNGKTYPLRGKGVGKMPTLIEVLKKFPEKYFLIHHKDGSPETAKLLASVVKSLDVEQRRRLYYFGSPEVYAEYIKREVPEMTRFLANSSETRDFSLAYKWDFGIGNFPKASDGLGIVIPLDYSKYLWGWPYRFLKKAEQANVRIYLMIDNKEDAEAYADSPVDGIYTNYIEVIGEFYQE